MPTRAPAPGEDPNIKDEPRVNDNLVEPFMYTFRQLSVGKGVKMIYWYIAAVDEDDPIAGEGETSFELMAFSYDEAVNKLTYQNDREIVARAIELVEQDQQL
jgi:hypothetical protein